MSRKTIFVASACLMVLIVSCVAPSTKRVSIEDELLKKEQDLQRELSLKELIKYQDRLTDAAWPIMQSAVPLCDQKFVERRAGVVAANYYSFDEDFRDAAEKVLGVGEKLQVVGMMDLSAAVRAGMRKGDILLEINGVALPEGEDAEKTLQKMIRDSLQESNQLAFKVGRSVQGEEQQLTISYEADNLCYFPALLAMSDAINAYADGKRVVITKGMMRFVEDDIELALVVAHEMAHNMMAHIEAKKRNYWLGTLADIAAMAVGVNTQGSFGAMGARAYSQEFEAEADYVGLYILALADKEIENAADFWRRMAVEHPGSIKGGYSSTHPSSPERYLAIEKTVQEIRDKQAAGLPLEPDKKQ